MIVPDYDFKCVTCNITIELQDSAPIPCSFCGLTMERVWSATPVHFKGGGFYSTGG